MTFVIAVAVQNDFSCHAAVKKAIELAMEFKDYKLYFVYAVAKISPSSFPYLDRMDKAHNLEAHAEALKDMGALMDYLDQETRDKAEYEFVKLEKQMDLGDIIVEFANTVKPNLFFVGTHHSSGLKKFMLGSVSEYLIDHLDCPVVICNPELQTK